MFDFILFRQPFLGWTVLSILLLLHAFRIKWYELPKKHIIVAGFLLVVKLLVLGLVFFSGQLNSFGQSANQLFVAMAFLLGFLLFDIYVIIILMYAYNNLDFVLNTEKINRAYFLWRLAWFFYVLGYIILLIYTVLQLYLFSGARESLSEELTASTELEIVSVFRFLDLVIQSGVGFFIVIILIGIIAVRYPEGVVISHAQVARALAIYDKTLAIKEGEKAPASSDLSAIQDYLAYAAAKMEEVDE